MPENIHMLCINPKYAKLYVRKLKNQTYLCGFMCHLTVFPKKKYMFTESKSFPCLWIKRSDAERVAVTHSSRQTAHSSFVWWSELKKLIEE